MKLKKEDYLDFLRTLQTRQRELSEDIHHLTEQVTALSYEKMRVDHHIAKIEKFIYDMSLKEEKKQ